MEDDWRALLSQDTRNTIINKILDTLKKHVPIFRPDGLVELQKIAVRFEEKIYTLATSQTDYLQRISKKMLTIETKSQTSVANSSAVGGQNPSDAVSVDSTAQTGHNAVDWQEEVYQKLKSMKEMYFMDISELHNRLSVRYQQHAALTEGKQLEQVEKIKMFRTMLERIMHILNLPKSGIQPGFKEKLAGYEKQIVSVLNSQRIKKPTPLLQQGQQPNAPAVASLSSMPQQPTDQMSQLQQHDSLVNQMQPTSMQSSNTSSMSMPLTTNMGAPHAQQSMLNSLPPVQNLDQAHGNATVSCPRNVMASLQQNSVNGAEQGGVSTLQQGVNLLQPNMNTLQSNANILQRQPLKQQLHDVQKQPQQHLMQDQQLKQQYQQRHMHPQFMQQQKQFLIQQQQQQFQQTQQKKQMPQIHQMNNDASDLKIRPGSGLVKSGLFPQHHQHGQRPPSYQQPLKTSGSFPISSPQLLQSQSPQISQHPSLQIDGQSLHTNISKTGTPLQSANCPFAPSPSTPFTVPSPIPGEQEKQTSGISSISNAGNVGSQQVGPTLSQANPLAIGTPGMSASPLLAEFTGADGNQGDATVAGKASTSSMSSKNVGVTHAQQSLLNSPQPIQNLDQGHGNAMASSQQNVMSSLQQNSVNGTQQ